MLKEFREFIARGSVIDLAVGIVIGAAFGNIVNAFVEHVLMPPIGLLLGGMDVSGLFIDLSGKGHESLMAARMAGAPTLNYGIFLYTVVNFLIIAAAVFLVVKAANRLRAQKPVDPTEKDCPFCRTAIPLAATRCPNCTSQIGGEQPA